MPLPFVVGYIPTPEGEAALDRAAQEARAHGAKLYIANIVHDDGSTIDKHYVSKEAEAVIAERLTESNADFEIIQVQAANVADGILSIAREKNAGTIVIGLRRRSRVGKLVLGSTAQRILMDADSSVLGVRTPKK